MDTALVILIAGYLVFSGAQLRKDMRELRERVTTLERVLNALLADPRLVCEHGVLHTLHCQGCAESAAAVAPWDGG